MSQAYVPGAPRTARDRAAATRRTLHRRKRGAETALARFVAARSDRQLERFPGPLVVATTPLALRAQFRPEYAVDLDGNDIDAVILLTVLRDGGQRRDEFEVAIARRRCRVRRRRVSGVAGGRRRPDGTLTLALADLIRMQVAGADPLKLSAQGRVSITGDTFLVIRFPGMFRTPTRGLV